MWILHSGTCLLISLSRYVNAIIGIYTNRALIIDILMHIIRLTFQISYILHYVIKADASSSVKMSNTFTLASSE